MPRRQSGFTLVELLIVVLIIGILATIAIPVFNGQRVKAKDAVAKSATMSAIKAAYSYGMANNTNFANFDLAAEESSLTDGGWPATTAQINAAAPGPSAVPTAVKVLELQGSDPYPRSVALCSVSKGRTVYCAIVGDRRAYGTNTGSDFSVLRGKGTDFIAALGDASSNNGW